MRNDYEVEGDVVKIKITRKDGSEVEVVFDAEDLDKIKYVHGSWISRFDRKMNVYYVQTQTSRKEGKRRVILMHRIIMNTPDGMITDHINGNPLDNRKCNLRNIPQRGNLQNLRYKRNNKSGVMNVTWHKRLGKWCASITVNGNKMHLGYFSDIEKAREVVAKARAEYMPFSQEALRRVN